MGYLASHTHTKEILAMSPSRMVVALYDNAMSALRTAVDAVARNDIETRCNAINLACDWIATLHLCLDRENGGEVARNLGQLYEFLIPHLQRVNLYNDPVPAEQAIALLEPLRDSWFELDKRIARAPVTGRNGLAVVASMPLSRTARAV